MEYNSMQENVTAIQHEKLAYSIKDLSKLVGICERTLHYEIGEGKLKTSRIRRRIVIPAAEVDRWLENAAG